MTCILRASFEPFPQKWKQGGLQLDGTGIRWARGLRLSGGGTLLPTPVTVRTVREVEGAERIHVKARFFQVIEASTALGDLLLGVPKDSVALVVDRLRSGEQPT